MSAYINNVSISQDSPKFSNINSQNSSKKQSILKKTPSKNLLYQNLDQKTSTPSKNVKFNSEINVNQFYSSPEERFHEILVNSPKCEQENQEILLNDEIYWSNTKKVMEYKSDVLEEEIEKIEEEIMKFTQENEELSILIGKEQFDFIKNGYKNVEEKEIEHLILQNKSLQELVNEKIKENETMKLKMKENQPNLLQEKIFALEKSNLSLENQIDLLKMHYESEINQFKLVGNNLYEDKNALNSLKKELEIKENEIREYMKKLANIDQMIFFQRNSENFTLEIYVLACAEFERLNEILKRKREENQAIERKIQNNKLGSTIKTMNKDN